MSAETLRRAAALMRERAEAVDDWYSAEAWATTAPMNLPIEQPDAEHIASWHPAVALAVADWLDAMASRAEAKVEKGGNETAVWSAERYSLTVARAYLGES